MFVTIFVGILDISTGELRYCNAGHNPPVFIKKGSSADFFGITKAIPVGLFEDFDFVEEIVQMQPFDQLFLYTDGLTEAENAGENLFGEEKLLQVIRENASSAPRELIDSAKKAIAMHVNGFEQSDDLTMMGITYYGKNNGTA